jgi:ABC-type bacteriocin/lantibiotic exporter with double-glycine peptidase domain
MEENKEKLTPWQRLIRLVSLERKSITAILGYAVFAGLVTLTLPLGIQAIINFVQSGSFSASLYLLIALVLLGVFFAGILRYMQMRIAEDLQQRIFTRSSFEFIYRFPKIVYTAFGNRYPPELANRFFDTITIQKDLPKSLLVFAQAIIQIIFGIILLSFYHPFFILFGLLLLILIYVVFQFSAPAGVKTSIKESKHKYEVAHWIEEVAKNSPTFKLSDRYSLASNKNDSLVTHYLNAREDHFKILRLQFFKMIGFKLLVVAALLIIGGLLVVNQQMNIGQFVASEVIVILMVNSVEKLILQLESLYDVLTALEKIGEIVDLDLEKDEGDVQLTEYDDINLQLSDLSLIYPQTEKHALKDIDIDIKSKEHIYLEGSSGSGKTSLLKILTGLVIPSSGNLFVNGHDVKHINLSSYRSLIGHSLLEELPFEGTIRENIKMNNPLISDQDIDEVLENLDLTSFVQHQNKGLSSIIGTEARHLPYTTAKKIMLARAVVTKPKFLVLKDPLVEFDDQEIKKILNYLFDEKQPWTIIVVSRNKNWKNYCRRTVHLKDGQIVNN